jgi:hypothetical protein
MYRVQCFLHHTIPYNAASDSDVDAMQACSFSFRSYSSCKRQGQTHLRTSADAQDRGTIRPLVLCNTSITRTRFLIYSQRVTATHPHAIVRIRATRSHGTHTAHSDRPTPAVTGHSQYNRPSGPRTTDQVHGAAVHWQGLLLWRVQQVNNVAALGEMAGGMAPRWWRYRWRWR